MCFKMFQDFKDIVVFIKGFMFVILAVYWQLYRCHCYGSNHGLGGWFTHFF